MLLWCVRLHVKNPLPHSLSRAVPNIKFYFSAFGKTNRLQMKMIGGKSVTPSQKVNECEQYQRLGEDSDRATIVNTNITVSILLPFLNI